MKKMILTAITSLGLVTATMAQNPKLTWAKSIGGISIDIGQSITLDASGNSYITGSFQGTADFDPGVGIANLSSKGATDIFLAKYDNSGNFVFAISIGGSDNDNGQSIAVDALGNSYITGTFYGTVDFDPGIGTTNLTSAGTTDIFLAKYNNKGDLVFASRIGGTDFDYCQSIALDGLGNIYITGFFQGTADFDPSSTIVNLTSAGANDFFIAKYNTSGSLIYANRIGGIKSEWGQSIAVDATGNTYVTGYFEGTSDFDPGVGIFNLTASSWDIFLAKYDASGKFVFANRMGSTGLDTGNSIAVDAMGNSYVTGYFTGIADFDPGVGTVNLISSGNYDIFLAKYNSKGALVFANQMGGSGFDIGNSVAVDGIGNSYITGKFQGTADFDPGIGTMNLSSEGNYDIFFAKYTPFGEIIFANKIGGVSSDSGNSIAIDGSTNAYITGHYSSGPVDFDPNEGNVNLKSAGIFDIFIAKYFTCTSTSYSQNIEACNLATINGKDYTHSQVIIDKLINKGGCDSTVTTNLTIDKSAIFTQNVTACNSVVLNCKTYTNSQTIEEKQITKKGCDSIVSTILTIYKSDSITQNVTADKSAIINGKTYTSSQVVVDKLSAKNGCGIVLTTNLTIKDVNTKVQELNALEVNIQVYPNPFTNDFNLEYTLDEVSDVTIQLVSILGNKVFETQHKDQTVGNHKLNLTSVKTAGVYNLIIVVNNKQFATKVVKLE